MKTWLSIVSLLGITAWIVPGAGAQTLSGGALVEALKHGGLVVVMRHASSPRDLPDAQTANADNVTRERQLDAAGRAAATAMGRILRALAIPVGEVYTSPTYRTRETARLLQLPNAKSIAELGDSGQSMQGIGDAEAEWLRRAVRQVPIGTVTVIVTHQPNIARAFPEASDVLEGEALVFGRDGAQSVRIAARVKIEEWPSMVR